MPRYTKPWDARKLDKKEKVLLNNLWAKLNTEDKIAIDILLRYAKTNAIEDYQLYKGGGSSMNY